MHKKILIITAIFPPTIGGPAQYIQTLLGKLPREIETKVISLADKDSYSDNLIQISIHRHFMLRQWLLFKAIFSNLNQYDIAYVQGTITVGFASMLACLLKGKQYFIKYVGDEVWEKYQSNGGKLNLDEFLDGKKGFLNNLMIAIEKIILSGAKKVIVPGIYLQNILKSVFNVDACNIPNAIELSGVVKKKRKIKSIIYVGRLVPWKQVDKVLEAFKYLLEKDKRWSLTIAGDGSERNRLEQIVKSGKLQNVTFAGSLSKQQVLNLMAEHEYLILFSSYEGMSHTLLDAMGLGLKIVASDILANRTVVRDGAYGKLVSPNKINDLSNAFTNDYDSQMIDNAKAYVLKKHNWDKHVDLLLKQIL